MAAVSVAKVAPVSIRLARRASDRVQRCRDPARPAALAASVAAVRR